MRRVIFIALGLGVCIAFIAVGLMGMEQGKKIEKALDESRERQKEKEEETQDRYEGFNYQGLKETFESANHITIEKMIRTTTEDEEAEYHTAFEEYVISDIDLKEQTDSSEDFSNAFDGEMLDEEKAEIKAFNDIFGFDYKNMNAWEIQEKFYESCGIEIHFKNATLEEGEGEDSQYQTFILSEDVISKDLLDQIDCDEILDKKVTCSCRNTEDGVMIPEYYLVNIRYTKDDLIHTKTLYLQVGINDIHEPETSESEGVNE